MPHEATVDHTDVVNDDLMVGAHMRGKDTWSKNPTHTEGGKQVTNVRPPNPENCTINFDDDTSSDEGSSEQLIMNSNEHKINGVF